MTPTRRALILVLVIAGASAAAFMLPLGALPATVGRLGLLGPFAGVAIGAALLVALVPRTPISLACGVLFGAGLGSVCALALALVAAAVTFAAGRWLGRDFVIRHAGRHWARLEGWVEREGTLAVAAVRSFPLGPYGLAGYAYGASSVRTRHYALGTAIAAAPSAVTYAIVGAAVARADRLSPLSLVPLAVSLLLSAAVVLRARRASRSSAPAEPVAAGLTSAT